jgi:hypothetical protein
MEKKRREDLIKQPSVISLDDPMSTVSGHNSATSGVTTTTTTRRTRKRTAQQHPKEEECFEEIELRRRQDANQRNISKKRVEVVTENTEEKCFEEIELERRLRVNPTAAGNRDCNTTTVASQKDQAVSVEPSETETTLTRNQNTLRRQQPENTLCCTENTDTSVPLEKHLDKAFGGVEVVRNRQDSQDTQLANPISIKAQLCNKPVTETEATMVSSTLAQMETSASQQIHVDHGDDNHCASETTSCKEKSLTKPLRPESCQSPEIVANKTTTSNLQLVKSATSSISSKETSIEDGQNHMQPERHRSLETQNASIKPPIERSRKIPLTTYEYVEEDAYEIHEVEPLDIHNISSDDDDEHISVAESRKKLQFALAKAGRFPDSKRRSRNSVNNTLRRSDSTDEESTLASTAASTSAGPVSYVEFHSEVVSQPKPRPQKPTTLFTPNDDRLADIPKLLAVDLFSDEELHVKTALKSFRSICNESNLPLFFKYGGPLGLISVLRKWSSSATIQAAALETFHKAGEMTEFANVAVELGALDLVLLAMKNHCDNADVLTAGCGALLNLTLPASVARALVFELDGIQIIAAACAAFPQNLSLQKYALYNLQYMSYWDDFKEPIVAAGGLQALTEMMETFKASPSNTHAVEKSAKATMKRLLE